MKNRWVQLTNERGAAFLMVLLATGFVMFLALFMLSSAQNANQQAHTISEKESARLLAEAGIDVYTHQLQAMVDTTSDATLSFPHAFERTLDGQHAFAISNIVTTAEDGLVVLSFTSTGTANGQSVSLEKTLRISVDSSE